MKFLKKSIKYTFIGQNVCVQRTRLFPRVSPTGDT